MKPQNPSTIPTEVYLSFVSSLFGNRATLFTGMTVQIVTFLTVYMKTGAQFYAYLTAFFVFVCIFRIYWFKRFDSADKSAMTRADIAGWERIYLYGGVATTAVLGVAAAYAILILQDFFSETACICVALASMVSVVGRNYGSRMAVNLQTTSASLPIALAFLLLHDVYMVVLSMMLIPFILTTRAMANGVREFLYKNVIASRDIALIAERFDIALNNMTHGLIMLDRENRILVANRKACELLQIPDPELLKDCDLDVVLRFGARRSFADGSLPGLIQRQLMQLADGSLSRTLIQFNDDLYLEFSAKRREEDGVVLIFEDVTSRIRADRRILHMVRFDALTGLPNREYFAELVSTHLDERVRDGEVGILVLDIDDFKHVNDMKGHVTGDRLLVNISRKLKSLAGDDTIVGRLGGDQFVVFFPNEGGADVAAVIRELHRAMAGTFELDRTTFRISFSAGYLTVEADEFRMEEWHIKADLALFEAKSRTKGGCTAFMPEMDAQYMERQKLKSDLREAVENGRLHVAYQPMYRPDGTRIECAEALSRWIHPEKGAVPPNVFIQVAEEMGIVSGITRFMVNQACRDCVNWPAPVAVSVNLSVQDLRNSEIVDVVAEALDASGLDASRLHLEVTESCLVDDFVTVTAILTELRNRGVTIALDDFGTGFSSLSYLDSLPLDLVKIDRSFVRNIGEDARRFKLLRGTVQLARELGLKIVVEGVETQDQLALINKYRLTDLVQGYVFSMPTTAENIAALLDGLKRAAIARRRKDVA